MICEVCKESTVPSVLNLGSHPLCDDLIPLGSADKCEEFPIEIGFCVNCRTAHQLHPVPKRRLFPESYHYRSAMTQDVLNGMSSLVASTASRYGSLKGKIVVDIGCNDGSLLKFFRGAGATVLGVEPTAAAEDARRNDIDIINDYFDRGSAASVVSKVGQPDFVTFTNVFAHIENLDELLDSVAILLGENTRIIIENHYLGAVLSRFQFDTFYHEHPRTYSLMSFQHIAKRLGRSIESCEFPSRYGGNIRVVIGKTGSSVDINSIAIQESRFLDQFGSMREVIALWQNQRNDLLARVRCSDQHIYAKAFPGRAAILIRMLNLTEREIACTFEKPRSKKIGSYVPGTRIPIVSDDLLLETVPEPRRMLNLAWHIGAEVREYLQGIDAQITCEDIFNFDQLPHR